MSQRLRILLHTRRPWARPACPRDDQRLWVAPPPEYVATEELLAHGLSADLIAFVVLPFAVISRSPPEILYAPMRFSFTQLLDAPYLYIPENYRYQFYLQLRSWDEFGVGRRREPVR